MRSKKIRDLEPGDVIDRAGQTEIVQTTRLDEPNGIAYVHTTEHIAVYGIDDTETVR